MEGKENVFQNYAAYYDLMYRDKDYDKEVKYIDSLIQSFAKDTKSLLDVGCGTGAHDVFLADLGYDVTGVDLSSKMIDLANSKKANNSDRLDFHVSDMRTFKFDRKFDTILSLFHAVCYMNSNKDFLTLLKNVNDHLETGGKFIFDLWYGPGFMADLEGSTKAREKNLEDETLIIKRKTSPKLLPNDNINELTFDIEVLEKVSGQVFKEQEVHSVRYFFNTELELMFDLAGFKKLALYK